MKKKLSFFDMFVLGFGSIVGVGWSSALNNLLRLSGGPVAAATSFLSAAVIFVPVALSIKCLAVKIPISGGVAAYALHAFDPAAAFLGGWFITMSYIAILPFEAIAATDIIGYIFPRLRGGRPLYSIAGEGIYLPAALVGLLFAIYIAAVNWQGIKAGVRLQKFMTTVLLASSLVCIIFALLKSERNNLLEPVYAPIEGYRHTGFVLGALSLLSVAPQYFAGFDTIQQNVELSDRRFFGKAILGALLSAGAFYVLIFLATGLAYPWQLTAFMTRPVLANVFLKIYPLPLGKILWYICITATMAGLFGAWNGFFIASVRSMQGMAKLGLLPPAFGKTVRNKDTPKLPFFLCSLFTVAGIFLGAGVLDIVCKLSSIGFTVAWTISCLSAYKIKRRPEFALIRDEPTKLGTHILAVFVCMGLLLNSILPFMPGYVGVFGIVFLVVWASLGLICHALSKKANV